MVEESEWRLLGVYLARRQWDGSVLATLAPSEGIVYPGQTFSLVHHG